MSDQSSNKPPNGAAEPTPKRSVRDVAEAVYDDLLDADSGAPEAPIEPPVDESDRPRDAYGRFIPKEPGEADAPQAAPAPTEIPPSEAAPQQPAPGPGPSIAAPTHWSAEDRAAYAELPPKGQELFLRRYNAIERDYTQKRQADAQAVDFVQTLAPIFQNPSMASSLQQAGVAPTDAINQWGQFHLGILHPDPKVRLATVQEIARRAQIDPAALTTGRTGFAAELPEGIANDPAIKVFVDQIGKLQQEILTNRQQFQNMQNQWTARQTEEAQRITEWQVNSFADEVDAKGVKAHPYFDQVIGEIQLLFKADPQQFDMATAYRKACMLNDTVREAITQAGRQTADQQASNQRAALAAKGNLRGRTSPVAAPNGTGERRGLRETLEAAADEAGIN